MRRQLFAFCLAVLGPALLPAKANAIALCAGTISAIPALAQPGQPIMVTAAGIACPPVGGGVSYVIDFGDGITATVSNAGGTVAHAYATPAAYAIRFEQIVVTGGPPIVGVIASTVERIASLTALAADAVAQRRCG